MGHVHSKCRQRRHWCKETTGFEKETGTERNEDRGKFDNARNSCPIKCIKERYNTLSDKNGDKKKEELCKSVASGRKSSPERDTNSEITVGERFPFTDLPKACSCPICKCKCNFACRIDDVPKIMLQRKPKENFAVEKSNCKNPFTEQNSMTSFFTDIMKESTPQQG